MRNSQMASVNTIVNICVFHTLESLFDGLVGHVGAWKCPTTHTLHDAQTLSFVRLDYFHFRWRYLLSGPLNVCGYCSIGRRDTSASSRIFSRDDVCVELD